MIYLDEVQEQAKLIHGKQESEQRSAAVGRGWWRLTGKGSGGTILGYRNILILSGVDISQVYTLKCSWKLCAFDVWKLNPNNIFVLWKNQTKQIKTNKTMIFNEPKRAHKTKPSYQDIVETAHTEVASLAKRQKQIAMNKEEQLPRRPVTCKAIQKNNQLTEATRQRLPSVTAELSPGIIKVCEKGWRGTA